MGDLFNWGSSSQADRDIRYRMELEALFEQAARLRSMQQAGQGGVGGGSVDGLPSNCIQFVANTSAYTNFEMEIDTDSDTTFTVDWGNGDSSSGELSGTTNIAYEYSESDRNYVVRLCFADPGEVTRLDFYGED